MVILSSDIEAQRFSDYNIRRSEFMYGHGWQSPGGRDIVERFARKLRTAPQKVVLDIGSGLGGALLYLAQEHDMVGLGVDYADAMVHLSIQRAKDHGLEKVLSFVHGDFTTLPLDDEAFDVVWSRDAILYMKEKETVFSKAYGVTKRGGQLLVTDFLRGDGQRSSQFEEYLQNCGYHLQTFSGYTDEVRHAGFSDVEADDLTEEFIYYLEDDLRRLKSNKKEFFSQFTQDDYDYLKDRWLKKITFCKDGDLKWGQFLAEKK